MVYPDGNVWQRQQLELQVALGPEVPAALYHVDVKLGAVKEYSDELSAAYAGANGAHRMKEALALVKRTPRKFNNDGSISNLESDAMIASSPNPKVIISALTFTPDDEYDQVDPNAVSGRITVSGTIGSLLCDMVPGAGGTIEQVTIYPGAEETPVVVPVQVTKGQGIAPRKYHFSGVFATEIPVKLKPGTNTIAIRAKDPRLGKIGSAEAVIEARRDGGSDPSPEREATGGFVRLEQPFIADIDLSSVDPAAVESGAATLSLSVTARFAPEAVTTSEALRKSGTSGLTLRGETLGLSVLPGVLAQAQSGVIDEFVAMVDASTISWQARTVVFRRNGGNKFISDYYNMALSSPDGLDGSHPISVTISRGAGGIMVSAALTKIGDSWVSSDSSISLTFQNTASADGTLGITALVDCASLSTTKLVIQASQTGLGATTYATASIQGPVAPTDQEGRADPGRLHSTYYEVVYQDDRDSATIMAFEVEGPEQIISRSEFTVPTKAGERKVIKVSGKYYLATANGEEPEALMLIANSELPAGNQGEPPPVKEREEDEREDGAIAYAKGFVAGAIGGGASLVTGTIEVVAAVAVRPFKAQQLGVLLLLSWVSEDAERAAFAELEADVQNAEAIGQAAETVAKILTKVQGDRLALYRALASKDIAEQERILGEYAIYAEIGSEFFSELIDEHEALDDYHKGVCAGRIFFEVVLVVLPMLKGAQLVNAAGSVSKITAVGRILGNIQRAKWLEKMPLNMQGAITRAMGKMAFIWDQMKKTRWLAKGGYGRDGERIWTLMYHYKNRLGQSPVEAMRSVEKNHKKINPKAWAAAGLDALAEESKLAHVVRADGARIIKLEPPANRTMFWSGLGRGGSGKAKVIAEAKGLETLEVRMDAKGVSDVFNDKERLGYIWKDEYRIAVWDGVSEQFAKEASGKVYVALGDGVAETSVWSRIEFPALTKNLNVQEIWRINPTTLEEILLWSR